MNTNMRRILSVAISAASLGVGVFSARAINPADDESSEGIVMPVENAIPVDGAVPLLDDAGDLAEIPLIAPVFVGSDPTILDQLLAGPPAIPEGAAGPAGYQGEGSDIIGAITRQIAFAGSGGEDDEGDSGGQFQVKSLPFVFASIPDRFVQFPTHAFDICAGRRPGTKTSVPVRIGFRGGCPVGFAGTLNGLFNWPTPFIRGEEGYHSASSGGITQTCAAPPAVGPDQTGVTAFSSIPLTALRAEARPHLTLRSWESQDFPVTSEAHAAHWTAERAAGIFTTDALLPHCGTINRDPDRSYDVRFIGTGIDGNVYQSEIFTLWSSTPSRPPTIVRMIDELPAVTVRSWTVPGGRVKFTHRQMADDSDTSCRADDTAVDQSLFSTTDDAPFDLAHEEWSRRVSGGIGLYGYWPELLCVYIYDASSSQIGIDTFVLRPPTVQRPFVTLEAVRLSPGVTIPAEDLWASAVGDGGLCAETYNNAAALSGAVPIGFRLWDCGHDAGYTETISAAVGRFGLSSSEPPRRTLRSIPVSFDICDVSCPVRPMEWYEIPIPPSDGERCGEHDGEFTAECVGSAGVAIFRVEYRTRIGAPGTGSTELINSDTLDPTVDPATLDPVLRIFAVDLGSTLNWTRLGVTIIVQSDTPVTLLDASLNPTIETDDIPCAGTLTFVPEQATEFALNAEVCASTNYELYVRVRDEAGFEYDVPLGLVDGIPMVVGDGVHTTIEFTGGGAPRFATILRGGASLDGQSAALWGYTWSGTPGPVAGCISMDDSVLESDSDRRIVVDDGELNALAVYYLTGFYQLDCEPADGIVEIYGAFSLADLQSGAPLVATAPAGSANGMRITITGDWHLEWPDGSRV